MSLAPLPFFSLPLPPPSFTFRSTSLFSLLGALARVPALREFVLPAPCYHRHIPRVIHMACRIQRDLEFHPPTPIQVTRAHDCPQLKAHHSITCPIIVFSGRAKLRGDCEVRGPAGVPARVPSSRSDKPVSRSCPQAEANQAASPFKPRVQTCTTQRAKGTYAGPPCWPRRAAASAQKLTAPEERASGWSTSRPQVLNPAGGGQGAKADSTRRSSRAVPHPSTNRALRRLTSEFRRDPVHSTRYGRQRDISVTAVQGMDLSPCPPGRAPHPTGAELQKNKRPGQGMDLAPCPPSRAPRKSSRPCSPAVLPSRAPWPCSPALVLLKQPGVNPVNGLPWYTMGLAAAAVGSKRPGINAS